MTRSPRLVAVSFQWCSVYCPARYRATVTSPESRNGKYGTASSRCQSVTSSAIEHPTMRSPPTSSPHRMFRSSMNAASTDPRRGGDGGGGDPGGAVTAGMGSGGGGADATGTDSTSVRTTGIGSATGGGATAAGTGGVVSAGSPRGARARCWSCAATALAVSGSRWPASASPLTSASPFRSRRSWRATRPSSSSPQNGQSRAAAGAFTPHAGHSRTSRGGRGRRSGRSGSEVANNSRRMTAAATHRPWPTTVTTARTANSPRSQPTGHPPGSGNRVWVPAPLGGSGGAETHPKGYPPAANYSRGFAEHSPAAPRPSPSPARRAAGAPSPARRSVARSAPSGRARRASR